MNPSTMSARLAPYLSYCSSNRPLDDHGHRPVVLVVFDDPWPRETSSAWLAGPLGAAWRNPDVLEPDYAFA